MGGQCTGMVRTGPIMGDIYKHLPQPPAIALRRKGKESIGGKVKRIDLDLWLSLNQVSFSVKS